MIKIKIFTHLVHYRLFGENDFCWQSWEEPVRPIYDIYGKLSFTLTKERAQLQSYIANDAVVHGHNKNIITSHEKKSFIGTIYHSCPRTFCFAILFLSFFQLFIERLEFVRMRRDLLTLFPQVHRGSQIVKQATDSRDNKGTNEQAIKQMNKQTNEQMSAWMKTLANERNDYRIQFQGPSKGVNWQLTNIYQYICQMNFRLRKWKSRLRVYDRVTVSRDVRHVSKLVHSTLKLH